MVTGKLNALFDNIGFQYRFADTDFIPQAEQDGNPLYAEPLVLRWQQIRDEDVLLHIELPQPCFIDSLVLQFGPKAALSAVRIKQDDTILDRYHAETGKHSTQKQLTLHCGCICQAFDIILCSDFATIDLLSLDIFGAIDDGIDLFPTPERITMAEGSVPVSVFTACSADTQDAKAAAVIFLEKLAEKTGRLLPVAENGNICFVTDTSLPKNGYTLQISNDNAVIRGADLRALVYGAESFIKLIRNGSVPVLTVSDSPAKDFRGVHLFIPSMAQMDFAKRLIKYLISPMGYNTVILQVSGGMVYESHPEISAAFENAVQMHKKGLCPAFPHSGIAEGKPITKAQLREYIEYIRSFGIDVIPEVQSLSHVQYMTHAFPEIAEIPEVEIQQDVDTRQEDMLPSQFYRHSYCPSNERSYTILFDILDEIIEVFQPREFVHMGHDELREVGVCPICKHKSPAELFAMDVNRIHDYLAKKGLKMMIWADMLQPVTKYDTPAAIDMIPKDIVLLDFIWYFHLGKDIEDNLLEKGFDVCIGNLYSSHFPRYESRIRKQGIHGGQISAWVATNEYELQKEGKLYDLFMTAQMLWADSYSENYRLVYDDLIRAMMPQLREHLNNIRYPSRLPEATAKTLYANPVSLPTRELPPQILEIPLDGCYDSLVFWHTALRKITRLPWSELDVAAIYTLHYADGTTQQIPVTYGGNVGYWNRLQNAPLAHPFYRHTGYTATYYSDSVTNRTADGEPATSYRYEFLPLQKPIAKLTLQQIPEIDGRILLQKLEGVKTGN